MQHWLKHNDTTKMHSNARLCEEVFTFVLNLDSRLHPNSIPVTLTHVHLFIYHAIYDARWQSSLPHVQEPIQ